MDPSCHQATLPTPVLLLLLLWLPAVSLFLSCSPSHAADAASSRPPPPSPAPGGGRCSQEEASSLLGLFHGASFNITTDIPSWRPGTDCCTWEEVICEQGTGHVVGLNFGGRPLMAEVNTSSLLGLPHLTSINLAGDLLNFPSSSPSTLAGFLNLTHLSISMSGTFTLEFPRLPKLVSLFVSPSTFYGPLKLLNRDLRTLVGNLTGLQELDLDSIDLSSGSSGWCQALSSTLLNLRVLRLPMCSLSGDISCLSQFNFISEIYLDGNNFFSSGFPSFSSNSSSLKSLNLPHSGLTGRLPENLLRLPKLEVLDLSNNSLFGHLPEFSRSSALGQLRLSYTDLSGELPNSIGSLKFLWELDLGHCSFSGQIPDSMTNLGNLSYLNLADNNFAGPIPLFQSERFPKLSELNLGSNSLSGSIPSSLFSLPSLVYLLVGNNRLSGQLGEFADASSSLLSYIDLSNNELHGEIPNSIFLFPGLVGLFLSSNRFNGTPELALFKYTFFFFLDLSYNNLSGEIPHSMCNATGFELLNLSNNNFTGLIPPCLANISTLSVLNLRGNQFSGILPQNFSSQCSLTTLDLSENQLHGQLPRSLANCGQLQVLNLRQNYLVDTFPCWLGDLPLLRVLVLQSNGLHGHVSCKSHLGNGTNFQHIRILDLSSNGFAGELPSDCFDQFKDMMVQREKTEIDIIHDMGYPSHYQDSVKITMNGEVMEITKVLNILITLDLSDNHFEGGIPRSMGKLIGLVALNISRNNLRGLIPSTLGDLVKLESLDLSRNMLSGRIPDQLTHLTSLSTLNLSYNQLYGSIPQGGQFSTFSNSSFKGNAGLCGPPLSRRCGTDGEGKGQPRFYKENRLGF